MILILQFTISTIVFFNAGFLIRLFISGEEPIRFGAKYLQAIAFFYPFIGINFVFNGVIRASGAMFQVLVLNLISFWVLRYPLTYWFSLRFGDEGIAYGIGISFIISALIAGAYFWMGKWKKVEVKHEEEPRTDVS